MTPAVLTTGVDAAPLPELTLARTVAVDAPRALFDLTLALRSVQALAPHTRRAYAADWEAFVECCRRHGLQPAPASPSAVETFIEFRSPEPAAHAPAAQRVVFHKFVKPGEVREPLRAWSLRRALATISAVHRWLKYPDPTRNQDVKDTLKINVTGRQLQAQKDGELDDVSSWLGN